MYPPYTVEVAYRAHVVRQRFWKRPLEVVHHWNYIAAALQCRRNLPVNPVFSVVVTNAAIEGVWSQYKDEMSGVADAAEKVVVELPGTELLDIEENGETTQL